MSSRCASNAKGRVIYRGTFDSIFRTLALWHAGAERLRKVAGAEGKAREPPLGLTLPLGEMQINRLNVDTWKLNFRRVTGGDPGQLTTLSTAIAAEAGELISVSNLGFEGSTGSGVITGNKIEMLRAVEELLAELDAAAASAAAAAQPVRIIYPTFGHIPW
jgi:hypothetical protein